MAIGSNDQIFIYSPSNSPIPFENNTNANEFWTLSCVFNVSFSTSLLQWINASNDFKRNYIKFKFSYETNETNETNEINYY